MAEEFVIETAATTGSSEKVSLAWHQAMFKAVFRPSIETYQQIANDPQGTWTRAQLWVVIASSLGLLVAMLLLALVFKEPLVMALYLVDIVMGTVRTALSFWWLIIITDWVARKFTGQIDNENVKLAQCYAAFLAPYFLLVNVSFSIPLLGLVVAAVLALYTTALSVWAVQAIYDLGMGKAFFVALVMPVFRLIFTIVLTYSGILS